MFLKATAKMRKCAEVCTHLRVFYSKRSDREVRGAGQVLQLVWAHKELRRPLEKDGWKKTDFMVNLNPSTTNGPSSRANGTYEDTTTPLLDRGECAKSYTSILCIHTCLCVCGVLDVFDWWLLLIIGEKRDMIPLNDLGPG